MLSVKADYNRPCIQTTTHKRETPQMRKVFKVLCWIILPLFALLNIITAFHAYKFTHYYDPVMHDSLKEHLSLKSALFGFDFNRKPDQALPDSNYETVYLTTEGLKLQAWQIKTGNPKGTVAMFHGHGGNKSDILNEAREFRRMGYNTFLLDFRAHGNSQGHICTIGVKESDDVQLAYNYLKRSGEQHIIQV